MTIRSRCIRAALAASTLLFATSCYYEGYSTYGAYDSYGYSSGGGASFVYTSSDRWFYDPVVYCYYDRHRRAYYDPYLYGYYPVGYVPRPIYGARHPGGWRPGQAYCPPPSNFRDRRLTNYHNRVDQLRSSRQYSWAGSVRERTDINSSWQSRRLQEASRFPTRQQAAQRQPESRPSPQGPGRGNSLDNRSGRQPGAGAPDNRSGWQGRQAPSPPRDDRSRNAPRPSFNQPVDTGAAQRQQQERTNAMRQRQAESQAQARGAAGRGRTVEPRPAPAPRAETRPAPPSREEASPSPRGGGGLQRGGGGQQRGGGERGGDRRGR